jgi:hypothetical protein
MISYQKKKQDSVLLKFNKYSDKKKITVLIGKWSFSPLSLSFSSNSTFF